MRADHLTPERLARVVPLVVLVVVVLALLVFAGSLEDNPLTPAEQRCEDLRTSANAVAQREDTTDDEVEYLERAGAAERACARR